MFTFVHSGYWIRGCFYSYLHFLDILKIKHKEKTKTEGEWKENRYSGCHLQKAQGIPST